MARSSSSPVAAPGTAIGAVPGRSLALDLLRSLRPAQWTKNLVVFAGLIFGKKLLDAAAVWDAIAAFVIFCALSGVVYLVNDLADRESDRRHPLKARRPIASGALPVKVATGAALAIGAAALAAAYLVGPGFAATMLAVAAAMLVAGLGCSFLHLGRGSAIMMLVRKRRAGVHGEENGQEKNAQACIATSDPGDRHRRLARKIHD